MTEKQPYSFPDPCNPAEPEGSSPRFNIQSIQPAYTVIDNKARISFSVTTPDFLMVSTTLCDADARVKESSIDIVNDASQNIYIPVNNPGREEYKMVIRLISVARQEALKTYSVFFNKNQ